MSEDTQKQSETAVVTKVVDENGKDVELSGDTFTRYRHKPLVVSAWKLPYMVQVTTPDGEVIGDIGDWLVIRLEGDPYICKSGVFEKLYSPVTDPPETEPGMVPTETTEAPIIQWKVDLHCEIAFRPDVLIHAWKTRLPYVAIAINFQDSDGNKTIFDAVVKIGASSNARAASMASDLLKRHFQNIEIGEMTADPV